MQGLNVIFSAPSHVPILRILLGAETPLTGRQIEKRCGLANRATMLSLERLREAGAIRREEKGRAYLFTINRDHYLIAKALKPAFDAEELFWNDLRKTVRKVVRPRPIAAVATGPLARDETESGGKVTLTMLFSSGRNRIRSLSTIRTLADVLRERYSLTLDPCLLDIRTMDREEYLPLWRRVEREGILLFGTLP